MSSEWDLEDQIVEQTYDIIVRLCQKVKIAAELYGLEIAREMDRPTLAQICETIELVLIPVLDNVAVRGQFSPESGMRTANVRTYSIHLQQLCLAASNQDQQGFDDALENLKSEAML